MNKKSVLGLLLFSCIVIAGMFLGTMLMIGQQTDPNYNQSSQEVGDEASHEDNELPNQSANEDVDSQDQSLDVVAEDEWLSADEINESKQNDSSDTGEEQNDTTDQIEDETLNPEDSDPSANEEITSGDGIGEGQDSTNVNPDTDNTNNQDDLDTTDTIGGNVLDLPDMQLISDSSQVDYMKYIPDTVYDSKIEIALDIDNPTLDIRAKSAILLDVETGKVLYYKDPVIPVFPASTSKLLTALVVLDWCMEEEEVTVGDELDLVATDSSLARLKKGQVLTIRNLIEGMLVPSGNDAAYVTAAFVGRKSLNNEEASLKESIPEFIKLMNNKAKSLGAINSCFKTPDGYDAIGQYTTAYDMGMIGLAAADNETILEISNKSSARNVFVDGSDVTWSNTNSLINKESGRYYPYCLGLKTGTSTMAGRCLISVAKKDGREVISVVMNSDAVGRWEDSTVLLKYGLGN
jgi:D-alanyl-D-alanine carboxypeptidase (penicillin-binding protein 5/6)